MPVSSSTELLLLTISRLQAHSSLSQLTGLARSQAFRTVLPPAFILLAASNTNNTTLPLLLAGEKLVRIIKDQIQVLNLTGEEMFFIEHWIITKKGKENLISRLVTLYILVPMSSSLAPPPPLSPVRILSLLLLTNCLMEVDISTLANNYFGGNIPLVHMIVDRNCGF